MEILKTVTNPSELFNSMTPKRIPGEGIYRNQTVLGLTARSVEDETRNADSNGYRNLEWWGDFSQLQIQIQQKSQFEFIPHPIKISIRLCTMRYQEI